jgi:hypothetical protein
MSSLRVLPQPSTDLIRFDFGPRSESRRGSSERGQAIVATVEPVVRKGLEETGYVAGQNVTVEYRRAAEKRDELAPF